MFVELKYISRFEIVIVWIVWIISVYVILFYSMPDIVVALCPNMLVIYILQTIRYWTCWIDIHNIIISPKILLYLFNRQIIQFEFSPTWSCVSLTRSTTSSEWKLFRFDKMEVNSFQNFAGWCHILSLPYLKCGTYCANKKWKPKYMRHRRLKG